MNKTISVIMPVYNGACTILRAVRSVQQQSYTNWEIVAVDDASTDESYELLTALSRDDSRIKVLRLSRNSGCSAARNEAMRAARGEVFVYLDCDDEYYPEFLALVSHFSCKADILFFSYDYVEDDENSNYNSNNVHNYQPFLIRNFLFSENLSTPLGVAHCRALYDRLGGFDEKLWCLEDWDYWKRLARTGSQFIFMENNSGLYHVRKGSLTRSPRTFGKQMESYEAQWDRGEPIYGSLNGHGNVGKVRKILAATTHSYFDLETGGASFASDLLNLLSTYGFICQAFCGSTAFGGGETDPGPILDQLCLPYTAQKTVLGRHSGDLFYALHGSVPVTIFRTGDLHDGNLGFDRASSFLSFYDKLLDTFDPDVLVTCGVESAGDCSRLSGPLIDFAKRRDIPIVYMVSGMSFGNLWKKIYAIDYIICNHSETKTFFWETLGVACHYLPLVTNKLEFYTNKITSINEKIYITCIDSDSNADLLPRIVEGLARQRPDIPLLVLTRGGRLEHWAQIQQNLGINGSFQLAERPWGSIDAIKKSRIFFIPSNKDEPPIPLVMSAMICGIPVVAYNLAPMPEVVGSSGILLDVSEWREELLSDNLNSGNYEKFDHWTNILINLWDDDVFYRSLSDNALLGSRRWQSEHNGQIYSDFFKRLIPQPCQSAVPGYGDSPLFGKRTEPPTG